MVQLNVRSDERLVAVGKTGSGKTFLLRHLLKPLPRLIVLDPKSSLANWGLDVWTSDNVRALIRGDNRRLRVPTPLDMNWEPYLNVAWEAGDVTVYIDEVYGIVDPGSKPPKMLNALYTRGRELGIGVWAATQRPAWVPLVVLSEAEWFFIFRLQLDEDRKRLASFAGQEVMRPITDEHGFYMYNTLWQHPLFSSGLDAKSGGVV